MNGVDGEATLMAQTGSSGAGGAGGGISVDSSGLKDFAGKLDHEVGQNLRPRVDHVFKRFELGTPFGAAHLSEVVQSARRTHHTCLDDSSKGLASYVYVSEFLVEAIDKVLKNYGAADAAAGGGANAVKNLLDSVAARATALRREAQATQDSTLGGLQAAKNHGVDVESLTGRLQLPGEGA